MSETWIMFPLFFSYHIDACWKSITSNNLKVEVNIETEKNNFKNIWLYNMFIQVVLNLIDTHSGILPHLIIPQ